MMNSHQEFYIGIHAINKEYQPVSNWAHRISFLEKKPLSLDLQVFEIQQ
jgi:hypothetical protein